MYNEKKKCLPVMHFHFVFMSVDLLQDTSLVTPEPNNVLKSEVMESSWVLRAWYSTIK